MYRGVRVMNRHTEPSKHDGGGRLSHAD